MKYGIHKKPIFNTFILTLLLATLFIGCQPSPGTTNVPPTESMVAIEPAPVEGEAEISTLLFRDDFQDGNSAGWTINSGWKVQQNEENYFFGTAATGGAYVKNGAGWGDYSLHASVWVKQGTLLLSIDLSSASRYVLLLGSDGVYLIKEKPAGTFDVLAEAGPITLSKWTRVTFASQQGHLQVYLDRVLWFDAVDAEPILAGTIAVGAQEGSRVAVDNILVNRIEGELPAGEPQAPAPIASEPLDTQELQAVAEVLPAAEVQTESAEVAADQPPVSNGTPDLIILPMTTMPYPIIQGKQFEAEFAVANNGNAPSGTFDVLVHFHAFANIEDCNMEVAGLAPGELAIGACLRTITGNTGNYPVELTADIDGVVSESDENNNLLVNTIIVIENPFPPTETPDASASQWDVAALSINFKEEVNGVSTYLCSFSTAGQGIFPFINIQVILDGAVIYETTYPAIPAGQSSLISFPVTNAKPFTLTCNVDANNSIQESNETNNSITVNFP